MSVFRTFISTLIEALFPLSPAERELLQFMPADAYEKLPKAPKVPIANCFSLFAYKDPRVTKLIWHIKYKNTSAAVKIGGYALFQALTNYRNKTLGSTPNTVVSNDTKPLSFVLIPMPITSQRRRERGYNQCELLIDEISKLDSGNSFQAKKDLLIRSQHTSRQTLKGREERLQAARGIFSVNSIASAQLDAEGLKNAIFIVIDDVITTGSTMNEAMKTLKDSGLAEVRGLSLAH